MTTNAIKLLEDQHIELDKLYEACQSTNHEPKKTSLFKQFADMVASHAAIEEEILYPAIIAKDESQKDLLLEALEEHLAVKRVLADLLEMSLTDELFEAKLKVMHEQLEHHNHKEEEKKLFPIVKKMFTQDELISIGEQMETRYFEMMASSPRKDIPGETDEAAPLVADDSIAKKPRNVAKSA